MLDSRSPPPTLTDTDVKRVLAVLSVAIRDTFAYDDSHGRRTLWNIFVGILAPPLRRYTPLLSTTELHVVAGPHGIAIRTVRDLQVNVDVLVPRRLADADALADGERATLARTHPHHALVFPGDAPRYRRFVPAASYVPRLRLEGADAVLDDYRHPVVRVLEGARDIVAYTPLHRLRSEDAEDTVYWHRFPCGALVALTNPYVDLHHLCAPLVASANARGVLAKPCEKIWDAFFPVRLGQCLDAIATTWIPLHVRSLVVGVATRVFGISDALVVLVEIHMNMMPRTVAVTEMCLVAHAMKGDRTGKLVTELFTWMTRFQNRLAWHKWGRASKFARALVGAVCCKDLACLAARYPTVVSIVAADLAERRDAWDRDDVERAHVLATTCDDDDADVRVVTDALEAWNVRTDAACAELLATTPPKEEDVRRDPPVRAVRRRERPNVESGQDAVAVAAPPTTHEPRVLRLCETYGLDATLIGSGVFHDRSDVDVVVTVPHAPSLADAYAWVRAQTGWTPQYDVVSDTAVVVLRGTFDGAVVDAQVWRGDASTWTRAEDETRRALELTRVLRSKTDAAMRTLIVALHDRVAALGFKGHCLCRLPGVAVTCLAIAAGRRRGEEGRDDDALLADVRDLIWRDLPCVSLDDGTDVACEHRRPSCALQVVVHETNVASRLTAAITRHFLDTLAWAVCAPTLDVRTWRQRSMVAAARVRCTDGARGVARTLHIAMARVDGHPLVDTCYVDEDGDALVLRVVPTAPVPERYAFRGDEIVTRDADTAAVVHVSRGARSWTLCTHPTAHALPGMRRVDADVSVPNAPHLTSDLLACFDARHWTHVA